MAIPTPSATFIVFVNSSFAQKFHVLFKHTVLPNTDFAVFSWGLFGVMVIGSFLICSSI